MPVGEPPVPVALGEPVPVVEGMAVAVKILLVVDLKSFEGVVARERFDSGVLRGGDGDDSTSGTEQLRKTPLLGTSIHS